MSSRKLSSSLLLVFFVLILFGNFASAQDKISIIVLDNSAEGPIKAMKSVSSSSSFSILSNETKIREYTSISGFSLKVTSQELEDLIKDSSIKVFEDRKFYASLDKSVPQILADVSWLLKINETNLTGSGETVCILDTGVNYSHSAFGNCYGENNASSDCIVIGGYDFVNEDDDPMDDYGHGTHVAGIIASSNLEYQGVSPGAKIIAIKVLDETGSGYGQDVIAGIDWCVNNASKFNISVISMSLGDNSTHNTYCNSDYFASYIDNAVSKNISVVIAAGNCDKVGQTVCTAGISSPACVQSAIAVGAVDDLDSIEFMRGALFELMAPGVNIISSLVGGTYGPKSGTSMAAPHVAGAITLLQQMINLQDHRNLSVSEIKEVFNDTGLRVDDTLGSGYNYSRINVYEAVLSLDNINPIVNLISPSNSTINLTQNQTFYFNATDWQLKNATFYLWNSSGNIFNNSSVDFTGIENFSYFSLNDLPLGNYEWNVEVYDKNNNSAFASENFSLTIGGVAVSINEPENDSYQNVNLTTFNCSAYSDENFDLINITFYLWNSTDLIYNITSEISGTENFSSWVYELPTNESYVWGCKAFNNNSQNTSSENYSITYDITLPEVLNISNLPTSTTVNIIWNTTEETNYSISLQNVTDGNFSFNHSEIISGLSASTVYEYSLTSCDRAGNCGSTNLSFTTLAAPVVKKSGGGGGGASISSFTETQIQSGERISLYSNGQVKFRLSNLEDHSLKVNSIKKDKINLTIYSEPFNFNLSVGEEKKLNLSDSDNYNFLVRLENITYSKATLLIKEINESINPPKAEEVLVEPEVKNETEVVEIEKNNFDFDWDLKTVFFSLICGVILVFAILFKIMKGGKKIDGEE